MVAMTPTRLLARRSAPAGGNRPGVHPPAVPARHGLAWPPRAIRGPLAGGPRVGREAAGRSPGARPSGAGVRPPTRPGPDLRRTPARPRAWTFPTWPLRQPGILRLSLLRRGRGWSAAPLRRVAGCLASTLLLAGVGLAATLLPMEAATWLPVGPGPAEAQPPTLTVPFVRAAIPVDPGWTGWKAAPPLTVALGPQAVARPWNLSPSIRALEVQALHNGRWIAFRLRWKDPTKDAVMRTDTFRDAVALMVPVGKTAAITMGAPGERVLILHWKADWQEDIDRTFQDVAQLYPNAWQDWYPFVAGEPPYDITAWTNPEARRYLTGWVLGNPRSQPDKRTAVEEQIAEGFSTLTTSSRQSAVGKGVHAEGQWTVVIARPLVTGDPNDPAWAPGGSTPVAFAVWDGAAGEIGARKGLSVWVTARLRPAR